jgi:hypothetical protein
MKGWIVLPAHAGNVDMELDLVPVRVAQVQRVSDDMVGQADDRRAGRDDRVARGAELVVGVADLEAEGVRTGGGTP